MMFKYIFLISTLYSIIVLTGCGEWNISGKVMDLKGNGIGDAVLQVETKDNKVIGVYTTDKEGNFIIQNLKIDKISEGKYIIKARLPKVSSVCKKEINLKKLTKQEAKNMNLVIEIGSAIEGKLKNKNTKEEITGAIVKLISEDNTEIVCRESEKEGYFLFEALDTDMYKKVRLRIEHVFYFGVETDFIELKKGSIISLKNPIYLEPIPAGTELEAQDKPEYTYIKVDFVETPIIEPK